MSQIASFYLLKDGRRAKERNLTPAGSVCTVWGVGPYIGRELTQPPYRGRILLPAERVGEASANGA